jgi:hypothetical protein
VERRRFFRAADLRRIFDGELVSFDSEGRPGAVLGADVKVLFRA